MIDAVPEGARAVARILLIDKTSRLLLLRAKRPDGCRFWLTPGGGLEPGESFEDAARRELREETGLDIAIGPWVWTRRHAYSWNGSRHDQYERFFVAIAEYNLFHPENQDDYVKGHRWWSLQAMQTSDEEFVPRRLLQLVGDVIIGDYPDSPIDCGV